jgi:transporter family protein
LNSNYLGILIGGIVPAIIFGIGGVFVKASNQQGISLNYYILFTSLGVLIFSIIAFFLFNEKLVNFKSGAYAFTVGATWAVGVLLVAFALNKYNTPMSIISALNCTACLVTILLSLLLFSEWKETHVIRLLIGSIMIVTGAMLVSTSLNGNSKEQPEVIESTVEKLP